jgi:CheY-like chemotaxis protein
VLVVHDITSRRRVDEDLKRLAETLEQRVAERTLVAEQRAAQLRTLAAELTHTEQRERRRLAQVLHDHLQQILVAAKLRLSALRHRAGDPLLQRGLNQVDDLIGRSIEASRTLTVELSPPILNDAGLGPALEWLARRMVESHGLTVDLELDSKAEPTDPEVRSLLFQASRELLFNIIKHADVERARLKMTQAPDGGTLIVISDEGLGFQPPSEYGGAPGSGFGLFSVRERLGFLGGRLELESEPGSGTRVTLYAPRGKAELDRGDSSCQLTLPIQLQPPAPSLTGQRKLRILVVDDYRVIREHLAGVIGDQPDMEVAGVAADGEEAVDLARQLIPDLILMDINMPRLNGIEATRRIKSRRPDTQIIGLSMHEKDSMTGPMTAAGAVDYVTKDAPLEQLLATIRLRAAGPRRQAS